MKTIFTLLALSLTSVTLAQATDLNLYDQLLEMALKDHMASPVEKSALSYDCTNFSGDWKGQCKVSNGHVIPSARNVEQKGCRGLVVSGEKYPIYGSTTDSYTAEGGFFTPLSQQGTVVIQPSWDEKMVQLRVLRTSSSNTVGEARRISASFRILETWDLVDSKTLRIHTPLEGILLDGGKKAPLNISLECLYTK